MAPIRNSETGMITQSDCFEGRSARFLAAFDGKVPRNGALGTKVWRLLNDCGDRLSISWRVGEAVMVIDVTETGATLR